MGTLKSTKRGGSLSSWTTAVAIRRLWHLTWCSGTGLAEGPDVIGLPACISTRRTSPYIASRDKASRIATSCEFALR
jgi:hypothetical protein